MSGFVRFDRPLASASWGVVALVVVICKMLYVGQASGILVRAGPDSVLAKNMS